MATPPPDRCGYTWSNYEGDDIPSHHSCCFRETLPDTDRCVWHADPAETEKTVEALRASLVPSGVRAETHRLVEVLDGANLSGLDVGDTVNLNQTALRGADLSGTQLRGADLSGSAFHYADLSGASLQRASLSSDLQDADFRDANLQNADLSSAYLGNADLSEANLAGADLSDAFLSDADLTGAMLRDADVIGAFLSDADLTGANLSDAGFQDADLRGANLSGTILWDADLSSTILGSADLHSAEAARTDFRGAELRESDLRDAEFDGALFRGADLRFADLRNASFQDTDLRDTDLSGANLEGADLAHAVLVRTNLFDANLTDCTPHGATFTDVQINDGTMFRSEEARNEEGSWWQIGLLGRLRTVRPRCGYDPQTVDMSQIEKEAELELLGKAADTYQTFEKVARENARPSLQSSMFVLRQDMQLRRHRLKGEHFKWVFARVSRGLFNYGESLGRITAWALMIIAVYSFIYARFDLVTNREGVFITDPLDALYFSTLTFTTLSFGDFVPAAASEYGRLLVTSQAALGTILIAIFVFVLGRRAAR